VNGVLDMRRANFKEQIFLTYYPETLRFDHGLPSSQPGMD